MGIGDLIVGLWAGGWLFVFVGLMGDLMFGNVFEVVRDKVCWFCIG